MSTATLRSESQKTCAALEKDIDHLRDFLQKINLPPEADYALTFSSLNRSFGDDEPEYTDNDLAMKNPNYVSPR